MFSSFATGTNLRAVVVSVVAGALLVPAAAAFAAPAPPTGTVIGTVTCGPAEETPLGNARIAVEGINLSVHADPTGTFKLVGVPALRSFTIDAIADPQASVVTSRYDVTVRPDETLDIGNLDLAICAQQSQAVSTTTDQSTNEDLREEQ